MILIKSIEVAVVEDKHIPILHCPDIKQREIYCGNLSSEYINITTEMVKGREYVTVDGRRIIIGMTKAVQDAIGLPYEAFENERKQRKNAWIMANGIQELFDNYKKRIEDMSFWQRFKALFVGIK